MQRAGNNAGCSFNLHTLEILSTKTSKIDKNAGSSAELGSPCSTSSHKAWTTKWWRWLRRFSSSAWRLPVFIDHLWIYDNYHNYQSEHRWMHHHFLTEFVVKNCLRKDTSKKKLVDIQELDLHQGRKTTTIHNTSLIMLISPHLWFLHLSEGITGRAARLGLQLPFLPEAPRGIAGLGHRVTGQALQLHRARATGAQVGSTTSHAVEAWAMIGWGVDGDIMWYWWALMGIWWGLQQWWYNGALIWWRFNGESKAVWLCVCTAQSVLESLKGTKLVVGSDTHPPS